MVRLKGFIGFSSFLFKFISIPYGAIKSFALANKTTACSVFQFLMVRLKDLSAKFASSGNNISIPYGAIKRTFLKIFCNVGLNFNSLWCD